MSHGGFVAKGVCRTLAMPSVISLPYGFMAAAVNAQWRGMRS